MKTRYPLEPSQPISIRFAGKDRALLQAAAQQDGKTESAYIRDAAVAVARAVLAPLSTKDHTR